MPDKNPENRLQQANQLYQQGDYAKALIMYEEVASQYPDQSDAAYLAGLCYDVQKNYSGGLAYARNMLSKYPTAADLSYLVGYFHYKLQQFPEAILQLETSLTMEPTPVRAHYFLGLSLAASKADEAAAAAFQKSIEAEPEAVASITELARTNVRLGKTDEAISLFEKAYSLEPGNAWNTIHWAASLDKSGETEAAAAKFKEVYMHMPPDAFSRNLLGNYYYDKKQFQLAIECYEKTLEADPSYHWADYNLALCYREMGDTNRAIASLKKSLQTAPDKTESMLQWAQLLKQQQKYPEALDKLEEAVSRQPSYAAAHAEAAAIYQLLGQPEKAIQSYSKAIEQAPTEAAYPNSLGNLYFDQKQYSLAIQQYDEALRLNPQYHWAWANKGLAQHYAGNPDEAIISYEKALELQPDYVDAYINKGFAYAKKEEYKKAVECYKKAIEYSPNGSQQALTNWRNILHLHENIHEALADFSSYMQAANSPASWTEMGNWYQYNLFDYEGAIPYYDKAIAMDAQNMDAHLYKANALAEMYHYEEAFHIYDHILQTNPKHLYASHNKAHYLQKMGRYKESREAWMLQVDKYEKSLNDPELLPFHKAWNCLYLSTIYRDVLRDFDAAYNALKKGEALDNSNMLSIQVALHSLIQEKANYLVENAPEWAWQARKHQQKAEAIFQAQEETDEGIRLMVELYYWAQDHTKTKEFIDKWKAKSPALATPYTWAGLLEMQQKKAKDAIPHFLKALRIDPFDINNLNNLAQAEYEAGDLEAAEERYLDIIHRDAAYFDAHTGIAEVYLSQAVKKTDDSEYFELAESSFDEALRIGKSGQTSKRIGVYTPAKGKTRQYRDKELADILYVKGYLKVKQFESTAVGRDPRQLSHAQSYFRQALTADPKHQKSQKALAKLQAKMRSTQSAQLMERLGPWLVASMSFLVLLFTQWFFFFPPPSDGGYKIKGIKKEILSQAGIKQEIIDKMAVLAGSEFISKSAAEEALEKIQAGANTAQLDLLQGLSLIEPVDTKAEPLISAGYYALLTFGSLIFLIAGFYMPQLLKLRIGTIELEKGSASTTSVTTGSIGLQR